MSAGNESDDVTIGHGPVVDSRGHNGSSSSDEGGFKTADEIPQPGNGSLFDGQSSSFNRDATVSSHGILKSLITLAPFVPKILKERIASNAGSKYTAFDTANMRDLVGASQTIAPSMEGVELAMMIADVKGFTALTEILSKKGMEIMTGCSLFVEKPRQTHVYLISVVLLIQELLVLSF